jgi:hypothetical protein
MSAQLRASPRQSTLSFTPRAPIRAVRPGPVLKPTSYLPTTRFARRLVGGINEQAVIHAFTESRERAAQGRAEQSDNKDVVDGYNPQRKAIRLNYTQEKKLAGIRYAETTFHLDKNGRESLISRSLAARTIGITLKMLRDWIKTKCYSHMLLRGLRMR